MFYAILLIFSINYLFEFINQHSAKKVQLSEKSSRTSNYVFLRRIKQKREKIDAKKATRKS